MAIHLFLDVYIHNVKPTLKVHLKVYIYSLH